MDGHDARIESRGTRVPPLGLHFHLYFRAHKGREGLSRGEELPCLIRSVVQAAAVGICHLVIIIIIIIVLAHCSELSLSFFVYLLFLL